MTRPTLNRLLALACSCLTASALAACGSDDETQGDPIPRTTAAELDRQLTSIENRFEFGDGACADIESDNVPSVRQLLAQLPARVDADTRTALRDSFDHLFELTEAQCDETKNTTPTTTETTPTVTTPPVTTETTPPTTATTETTPPPTTETAPSTTTSPSQSGQGGGSSGGNSTGGGTGGTGAGGAGGGGAGTGGGGAASPSGSVGGRQTG